MLNKHLPVWFLILALLPVGCTVDISQPAYGTTEATAESTRVPIPPVTAYARDLQTTNIPITWTGLNLSGRLVYLVGFQENNNPHTSLQSLDLKSGVVTTLYQAPPNWWISAAAVAPDEKQIVLSYATPANFPALYLMPLDGSGPPSLLISPPTNLDEYIEPVWSPDGRFIYFAHIDFGVPSPVFDIERIAYPNGTPEMLLTNAYWPRLSPDGSRLVYVSKNPDDKTDRLFISTADGSKPQQVALEGAVVPTIIDAPLFLPDGKTLLFSGFVQEQSFTPNWLDRLLGVQVASAHSLPEDWWSVPVAGGVPTQLTHLQAPSLYASLAPDGQLLASFSSQGYLRDGTGREWADHDR